MVCLVRTWHSISSSGLLELLLSCSSLKARMLITPLSNGLWVTRLTRLSSPMSTFRDCSPWPLIRPVPVIPQSLLVAISRPLALLNALVSSGVTPLSLMIGNLLPLPLLQINCPFMESSCSLTMVPLLTSRSTELITLQLEVKLLGVRSLTTSSIREPNLGIPSFPD